MNRREFLVGVGAAVTAFGTAGCLGGDDDIETDEETAFVTVWQTETVRSERRDTRTNTSATQIRLPLLSEGTYDFKVEWGDGSSDTIDSHNDSAVTHTYDEPGEYVVTIHGTLVGWSPGSEAMKLEEVRQWGDFDVSSTGFAFRGANFAYAENLHITAEDTPAVERGTSLSEAFLGTDLSVATGLSEWDVSKVRDLSGLFANTGLSEVDLSEWAVSRVEDMSSMFVRARSFDSDLSEWDVSRVEDTSFMFSDAESFDSDLSEWDVSRVEDMADMFAAAESFDSDLSEWDVSRVEDMSWMFAGAASFDSDLSEWDVSRVETMRAMFTGAESFDGDVSGWDVSNVEDMSWMFAGAASFDSDLSEWDVSRVENMSEMFRNAETFDSDLSEWDVSRVETMSEMFRNAEAFDGDVSGWDVSNVRDMSNMFAGANLSRENYDALLVAWADLDLKRNVRFSAGDTRSSSGEPAEARQYIVDEYGWNITDGGEAE